MFKISKNALSAEVSFHNRRIDLRPLWQNNKFERVYRAILSNEKITAQIYMDNARSTDSLALLKEFFQSRGWEVSG